MHLLAFQVILIKVVLELQLETCWCTFTNQTELTLSILQSRLNFSRRKEKVLTQVVSIVKKVFRCLNQINYPHSSHSPKFNPFNPEEITPCQHISILDAGNNTVDIVLTSFVTPGIQSQHYTYTSSSASRRKYNFCLIKFY